MAGLTDHLILRAILEFEIPRPDRAANTQETLSRLFWRRLLPEAERILDSVDDARTLWKIDRLTIDLGKLAEGQLEEELAARFARALADALVGERATRPPPARSSPSREPTADRRPAVLEHFLVHGSVPWWWTSPLPRGFEPILIALAAERPEDLRRILLDLGQQESVRLRLVRQFSEDALHRIVEVLEPTEAAFIIGYADTLQKEHREEAFVPSTLQDFQEAKWEFILQQLLVDHGSEFNRREFVRGTLQAMAGRFRVAYEELLRHLIPRDGQPRSWPRPPAFVRALRALWAETRAGSRDNTARDEETSSAGLPSTASPPPSLVAEIPAASSLEGASQVPPHPIPLEPDTAVVPEGAPREPAWSASLRAWERLPADWRAEAWSLLNRPGPTPDRIARMVEGWTPRGRSRWLRAIAGTAATQAALRLLQLPPFAPGKPAHQKPAPTTWVWEAFFDLAAVRTEIAERTPLAWIVEVLPRLEVRFRSEGRATEYPAFRLRALHRVTEDDLGTRSPALLPDWVPRLGRPEGARDSWIRALSDQDLGDLVRRMAPRAAEWIVPLTWRLLRDDFGARLARTTPRSFRRTAWLAALKAASPGRFAGRATSAAVASYLEAVAAPSEITLEALHRALIEVAPPASSPWPPVLSESLARLPPPPPRSRQTRFPKPAREVGHPRAPEAPLDRESLRRRPVEGLQILESYLETGRLRPSSVLDQLPGGPDALLLRLLADRPRLTRARLRHLLASGRRRETFARRFTDRTLAAAVHHLAPRQGSVAIALARRLTIEGREVRGAGIGESRWRQLVWATVVGVALETPGQGEGSSGEALVMRALRILVPATGWRLNQFASRLAKAAASHHHPHESELTRWLALLSRASATRPDRPKPSPGRMRPSNLPEPVVRWLENLDRTVPNLPDFGTARWWADRRVRERMLRRLDEDHWTFLVTHSAPGQGSILAPLLRVITQSTRSLAIGLASPTSVTRFVWSEGLDWLSRSPPDGDLASWLPSLLQRLSTRFSLDEPSLHRRVAAGLKPPRSAVESRLIAVLDQRAAGIDLSREPVEGDRPETPEAAPVNRPTTLEEHAKLVALMDQATRPSPPSPRASTPSAVAQLTRLLADRPESAIALLRILQREPRRRAPWMEQMPDAILLRLIQARLPRLWTPVTTYLAGFVEVAASSIRAIRFRRQFRQSLFEILAVPGVPHWSVDRLVRAHLSRLFRLTGHDRGSVDELLTQARMRVLRRRGPGWRRVAALLATLADDGRTTVPGRPNRPPMPRVTVSRVREDPAARLRLWRQFLREPDHVERDLLEAWWVSVEHDPATLYAEAVAVTPPTRRSLDLAWQTGNRETLLRFLTGATPGWASEFRQWIDWLATTPELGPCLPFPPSRLPLRLLRWLISRVCTRSLPGTPRAAILEAMVRWGLRDRVSAGAESLAAHLGISAASLRALRAAPPAFAVARLLGLLLERSKSPPPRQELDRLQALGALIPKWDSDLAEDLGHDVREAGRPARPHRRPAPERPRPRPKVEADVDEPIFITNAGLVLVAPFFPTYFQVCGLLEDGKFKAPAAAWRAIHLVQFLVTFDATAFEHSLTLNKVLCGVPITEPVPATIELSEAEQQAGRDLLAQAIRHWGRVTLSIEGFRDSFLWRPGKLQRLRDGWKLVVERRAYDLLLTSVPWSFGVLKTAYMPEPLFVEWI